MELSAMMGARHSVWRGEVTALAASVLLALYVALLAQGYATGQWLIDGHGRYHGIDFISFYTASAHLRHGAAALAYDWARFQALEQSLFGEFGGTYGWHYAPTLLLAVAPLAVLPYPAAFLAWSLSTLAAYAATIFAIVRHRLAWLAAIAFPAAFLNFSVGQSGALTAALVGAALGFAERRPALAGVFLGLLTYKPQFGIVFPFVLLASGRWRMIASAVATTAALVALTTVIFGPDAWAAFLGNAAAINQAVLVDGRAGAGKLQTTFGVMRDSGMDLRSCFAAQVLASAMTILLLMAVWRRSTVPYALKAAAAACGVLFATPYAYIYDHVVLAVALAFLVRHGLETRTGFLERSGIAAACGLILLFPFVAAPVGLAAQLLVAIMVAGRLNQCRGEKELGLPKVPALALAEPDRPR